MVANAHGNDDTTTRFEDIMHVWQCRRAAHLVAHDEALDVLSVREVTAAKLRERNYCRIQ